MTPANRHNSSLHLKPSLAVVALQLGLALAMACSSDPATDGTATRLDVDSPDGATDLAVVDDAPTTDLDGGPDSDAPIGDGVDDSAADPQDTADEEVSCPDPTTFDYSCDSSDDDTCPEGFCVFGQCIAPVVDPDRWSECGDGSCGPCETEETCPADCAEWPERTGSIELDNDTTITVMVPGFRNVQADEFEDMIYGEARSGGDLADWVRRYVPGLPNGTEDPNAPNQVVGVEYYGAVPADYLTAGEIEAIEAFGYENEQALNRYALIVATFIAHRLDETGATHVNLMCHSMGCHIIRFVIEHDLLELASASHIARWVTSAGVVGGARLARLYDNPLVRDVGGQLGLNTADFVHMHPDYVADHSAVWDHRLREANSPYFEGIIIHHTTGTDPRLADALGVRLLDISNPDDEPNDGLVFTFDEFFHDQATAVSPVALSGRPVPPTASYLPLDHFGVSESAGSGALAAAGLYHSRKVFLTLRSVTLLDDLERDDPLDFDHQGDPPAELIVESAVRFNPYLLEQFGDDVLIHEQALEDRSLDLRRVSEGATVDLDYRIFEGPVFDEMTSLALMLDVLEVDEYNRFDLHEWVFDPEDRLIRFDGQVSLEDQEIELSNDRITVTLAVQIEQFY